MSTLVKKICKLFIQVCRRLAVQQFLSSVIKTLQFAKKFDCIREIIPNDYDINIFKYHSQF